MEFHFPSAFTAAVNERFATIWGNEASGRDEKEEGKGQIHGGKTRPCEKPAEPPTYYPTIRKKGGLGRYNSHQGKSALGDKISFSACFRKC